MQSSLAICLHRLVDSSNEKLFPASLTAEMGIKKAATYMPTFTNASFLEKNKSVYIFNCDGQHMDLDVSY